jgi:hypothetical protein
LNTSWSFNPLDYGPLAGVVTVIWFFLKYIRTRDTDHKETTDKVVDVVKENSEKMSELTTTLAMQRKELPTAVHKAVYDGIKDSKDKEER